MSWRFVRSQGVPMLLCVWNTQRSSCFFAADASTLYTSLGSFHHVRIGRPAGRDGRGLFPYMDHGHATPAPGPSERPSSDKDSMLLLHVKRPQMTNRPNRYVVGGEPPAEQACMVTRK